MRTAYELVQQLINKYRVLRMTGELTLRDPSPGNVLSVYCVKNKNSSFVSQSSKAQFVNGTGTEAG